jgi:protein involved in polysaccharide export with SLBB domain
MGATVATLDLYDYLLHGDTHSDVTLQNGDVVFVPLRTQRVAVFGHVVREGYYDVKSAETLRDVMADAGGPKPDAESRVTIFRSLRLGDRVAGGPARTVIDATPAAGDSLLPAMRMEDGDSVSVTKLGAQRRGFVRVGGTVFQPGEYGLEPGMHLSDLISRAGGLEPATYRGRAHISRLNLADSTRSLVSVILPATGSDRWEDDPAMQDYDSVTVYGRPEMRDNVTFVISGMVNRASSYPWRNGMTLRDAVLMAHGLQPGAMLDSVEIARLPEDRSKGQLATTIRVPIDSTYLFDRDSLGGGVLPPGMAFRGHGAPEIPLKPYDNILVFAQPEFEFQRAVYIGGEVKFPGTYALRNKGERLTTLVRRAGGLTNQAYPEGIVFTRHVHLTGRVNIDLPKALRDTSSADNVILQPGDSVIVPEFQPSVRVTGAVNSPGSVLFRGGQGLGYYVSGAGGYAKNADGGRTSVRAANGEVRSRSGKFLFFGGNGPEPGPGSEIFVPSKDASQLVKTDKVALFGAIASILASALTTVLVLRRF